MPRDKQTIRQELLVLRCRRGDRAAFDDLIGDWEGRLFYYVRRLVESEEDAWDALQQTWLQAYRGIRSLRNPEHLPAWLYRIARCQAASRWRDRYRQGRGLEEHGNLAEVEAPAESDHFAGAEEVHRALEHLSLVHRGVLVLHFLEDFSLKQMAEVLDVPPGTVKSRMWHAKRALRNVLESRGGPS